jgi:hypothetical protein
LISQRMGLDMDRFSTRLASSIVADRQQEAAEARRAAGAVSATGAPSAARPAHDGSGRSLQLFGRTLRVRSAPR